MKTAAPKAELVTTYKPFGIPVSVSGTEKVRYAGEMQDSSSGLYYIFARYMDPELGRWLSLDPELGSLSMPQTMNRYVYCANNPLRFVDPTGMFWETVFDICCIAYDIRELKKNPTWENAGWLLLDVGCLIAPGVPALSPLFKGLKAVDRANDARKIADKGEDLSDFARHIDDVPTRPGLRSADDAADALRRADRTGIMESHHLFPVEHKTFFKSKGININSPEYKIRVDREVHKIMHGKKIGGAEYMNWNKEWGNWISDYGKKATPDELVHQMKTMMGRYGL